MESLNNLESTVPAINLMGSMIETLRHKVVILVQELMKGSQGPHREVIQILIRVLT